MARPMTPKRLLVVLQRHLLEICSHICDVVTLIGVVVLQDIWIVGATALCLGCSLGSLLFNGLAYKQGMRKVYPKAIDLAVPPLFVGLLPPAILYPDITHRYVFIAVNGWMLAVMLVSVLLRRPFTWQYMSEMFPAHVWQHPMLRRAGYIAAAAWMASLATMLGAAVATAVLQLQGFDITAIMVNYVLQLVPLLLVAGWSIWYCRHIKRQLADVAAAGAPEAAAAAAAGSAGSKDDGHPLPVSQLQVMAKSSSSSGGSSSSGSGIAEGAHSRRGQPDAHVDVEGANSKLPAGAC